MEELNVFHALKRDISVILAYCAHLESSKVYSVALNEFIRSSDFIMVLHTVTNSEAITLTVELVLRHRCPSDDIYHT